MLKRVKDWLFPTFPRRMQDVPYGTYDQIVKKIKAARRDIKEANAKAARR